MLESTKTDPFNDPVPVPVNSQGYSYNNSRKSFHDLEDPRVPKDRNEQNAITSAALNEIKEFERESFKISSEVSTEDEETESSADDSWDSYDQYKTKEQPTLQTMYSQEDLIYEIFEDTSKNLLPVPKNHSAMIELVGGPDTLATQKRIEKPDLTNDTQGKSQKKIVAIIITIILFFLCLNYYLNSQPNSMAKNKVQSNFDQPETESLEKNTAKIPYKYIHKEGTVPQEIVKQGLRELQFANLAYFIYDDQWKPNNDELKFNKEDTKKCMNQLTEYNKEKKSSLYEFSYNNDLALDFNKKHVLSHFTTFQNSDDAFGFFGISDDTLYISFKGTSAFGDLGVDLGSFEQEKFQFSSDGPTFTAGEAGVNSYKELRSKKLGTIFHKKVPEFLNNVKEIHISGHSLGGAYTTLCFLDLAYHPNYKKTKIIAHTFGAPRFLADETADMLFHKIKGSKYLEFYRWTNASDPIPSYFTHDWPLEFKHATQGIHIKPDTDKKSSTCTFKDQDYAPFYWAVLWDHSDHYLANYWRHLYWNAKAEISHAPEQTKKIEEVKKNLFKKV